MAGSFKEFMESLTVEELLDVLDVDIDLHEAGTPEARTVIDLMTDECPRLITFASAAMDMMPGFEGLTEDQLSRILICNVITMGAIYKIAQSRDLPQL